MAQPGTKSLDNLSCYSVAACHKLHKASFLSIDASSTIRCAMNCDSSSRLPHHRLDLMQNSFLLGVQLKDIRLCVTWKMVQNSIFKRNMLSLEHTEACQLIEFLAWRLELPHFSFIVEAMSKNSPDHGLSENVTDVGGLLHLHRVYISYPRVMLRPSYLPLPAHMVQLP